MTSSNNVTMPAAMAKRENRHARPCDRRWELLGERSAATSVTTNLQLKANREPESGVTNEARVGMANGIRTARAEPLRTTRAGPDNEGRPRPPAGGNRTCFARATPVTRSFLIDISVVLPRPNRAATEG